MPASSPTPERIAVGQQIRQWRRELGLNSGQVGATVGCSKVFVSHVERGAARLAGEAWPLWAKALKQDEQTVAYLFLEGYDPLLFGLLFKDAAGAELAAEDRTRSRRLITDDVRRQRALAGKWLKHLRTSAGYTMHGFAETLRLRDGYLYEIEDGENRLAIGRYAQFAHALREPVRKFALQMTKFYDPEIYEMLFGTASVDESAIALQKSSPSVPSSESP